MMLKKLTMLLLVCLMNTSSINAGIVDTINAPADYCLSTWYSHLGFIAGGIGGLYVMMKYNNEDFKKDDAGIVAILSVASLGCYHLLRVTISSLRCLGLLVPIAVLVIPNDADKRKGAFVYGSSIVLGSVVCAAALNAIVQRALLPIK